MSQKNNFHLFNTKTCDAIFNHPVFSFTLPLFLISRTYFHSHQKLKLTGQESTNNNIGLKTNELSKALRLWIMFCYIEISHEPG